MPLARMSTLLPATAAFLAARQQHSLGWGWQALAALPAWSGREPVAPPAPIQRTAWRGVLPAQLARFTPVLRPQPRPAAYLRFSRALLAAYAPAGAAAPAEGTSPEVEPAPPEEESLAPSSRTPEGDAAPVPELVRRLMRREQSRGIASAKEPTASLPAPFPARGARPAAPASSPAPGAALAPPEPAVQSPSRVAGEPAAEAPSRVAPEPVGETPAGMPAGPPVRVRPVVPAVPRAPGEMPAWAEPPSPAPPGGPRPLQAALQALARAVGIRPRSPPPKGPRLPVESGGQAPTVPPPEVGPPPVAGAARPAALPLARALPVDYPSAVPLVLPTPAPLLAEVPPGGAGAAAPEKLGGPPVPVLPAPTRPRLEALPLGAVPRPAVYPVTTPALPAGAPPEPVGPVLAAAGAEARHLSEEVRGRLARMGAGAPLPQAARRFLESSLRLPLAGVRLHTGPDAAAVTREIGAVAATVGPHVLLSAVRPDLGTPEGLALLAHEAVHAAQGGAARPGAPESREEEAAAQLAGAAVRRAAERRVSPSPVRYPPPPAMPLPSPAIAAEASAPTVVHAVREGWAPPLVRPVAAAPAAGPLRRALTVDEASPTVEPSPAQAGQPAAQAQGQPPDLDVLTEEILRRIRYRLELERERRGY